MEKRIILTEEEYNSLVAQSKVNEISQEEINYLRACERSLEYFTNPTRLCPKCGKAILVEGFICPVCEFDDSDYEE